MHHMFLDVELAIKAFRSPNASFITAPINSLKRVGVTNEGAMDAIKHMLDTQPPLVPQLNVYEQQMLRVDLTRYQQWYGLDENNRAPVIHQDDDDDEDLFY